MTISVRAGVRFDALRAAACDDLRDGALRASLAFSPSPPSGWCVALIARVVVQPGGAAIVDRIHDDLGPLGAGLWRYPDESLHISVVALTGREPEPIGAARAECLAAGLGDALAPHLEAGAFHFDLRGVGLVGTQLFSEVVPADDRWPALRRTALDVAESMGERPIRHDDLEPVHLNIARLVDERVDLAAIEELVARLPSPTSFFVTDLDVVVTDFVVSPDATTFVSCVRAPR